MREFIDAWEKAVIGGLLVQNQNLPPLVPNAQYERNEDMVCSHCGREFKSDKSLIAHKDRITVLNDIQARINRGEALDPQFVYSCSICNKRFYLFERFEAHMRYERRKMKGLLNGW